LLGDDGESHGEVDDDGLGGGQEFCILDTTLTTTIAMARWTATMTTTMSMMAQWTTTATTPTLMAMARWMTTRTTTMEAIAMDNGVDYNNGDNDDDCNGRQS